MKLREDLKQMRPMNFGILLLAGIILSLIHILKLLEVDGLGLDHVDRRMLEVMIETKPIHFKKF